MKYQVPPIFDILRPTHKFHLQGNFRPFALVKAIVNMLELEKSSTKTSKEYCYLDSAL